MIILVVLNYNDYETTSRFVEAVKGYDNLGKIIVVDNYSSDGSYELLVDKQSEKVEVIRTLANKGYASGNNFGIRYALTKYEPEYIIVSNPDVMFESRIIDRMRDEAGRIDHLGIITCKMNCLSGVNLDCAWKLPTYSHYLFSNLFLLGKLVGSKASYTEEYLSQEIAEVDAVPGSFFMMKTKAYLDAGGFDEDTFLYCEESIIAARMKNKGYHNYLITTETYDHNHSVTVNKNISSLKRKLQIRQESREIYCKKYLHIGQGRLLLFRATFYLGLYERILLSKLKQMLIRR